MRAEIIAVGTELTNGSIIDTNSPWLSTQLSARGLPVRAFAVVPDELPAIVDQLRQSMARSDFVVVTGGMGPTLDDLTRPALAEALGVPLELHDASLQQVREHFASRGRDMPERNVRQAMLPAGSIAIENPRGTAPGIWAESRRDDRLCRIIVMPGVPSEMKPMFVESVAPRLPDGSLVIRHYRLNCFGAGESAVEQLLGDLTARSRDPEVGITAHDATITLRITTTGRSAEECDRCADTVRREIRQRLGDLVFSEGDAELQNVVIEQLRYRHETLAVIETGLTGGRLADWLSAVPGTDETFRGGLTLVAPGPMLGKMLQRAEQIAGPSDVRTRARHEAEKARQYAEATWGLAVIGNGAQTGQQIEGAIGLVGPDVVATLAYQSYGDPAIDRNRAAKTALDLLRRQCDITR